MLSLYKHQQKLIDEDPNEIWKDIVGYEGIYEVSNLGRVKRIKGGQNRIMLNSKFKSGYLRTCLTFNSIEKTFRIHRLVATAFIPNPENKPFINHIDNNISNNNVSNLEWCTSQENRNHCVKQNRQASGSSNGNSKLKENDILNIRNSSFSVKTLSIIYKVTDVNIYDILNRKTWKHI